MAKGNLFLGLGRGSVGDVTFYRKNGEQISRVHTKSVRNPNTDGQLIQRAILATISKAYAAGSAIFDHSFEGCSVGAESQAKFQKENLRLLRAAVSNDLLNNLGDGSCAASVVGRNSPWPVPNAYRVSSGSLIQDVFATSMDDTTPQVQIAAPLANEKLGAYCTRLGIIDDDIFTAVCFAIVGENYSPSDAALYQKSYECHFGFLRLRVKTAALTSQATASTSLLTDLFEVDSSYPFASSTTLSDSIGIGEIVPGGLTGTIGVIRSRENETKRSTCDLMLPNEVCEWGYISKYLTDIWNPNNEFITQSPLILEGGNINLGR